MRIIKLRVAFSTSTHLPFDGGGGGISPSKNSETFFYTALSEPRYLTTPTTDA